VLGWSQDLCTPPFPCGSELARESGVSVNDDSADLTPSRASPLSQLFLGGFEICVHTDSPVGASLLAKAVGQLAMI
ncbi:hypothetical protein ACJ6X8_28800, partial [Pseudomonas alvandae]|uniref:hypothetical protein n=1 Tax=Pseudomonas TaxID=286 RepID=UPI00389A0AC6